MRQWALLFVFLVRRRAILLPRADWRYPHDPVWLGPELTAVQEETRDSFVCLDPSNGCIQPSSSFSLSPVDP